MHFSVFVCVCASRKSVCLLKSFIYIHRHFLDALNWFQARSWVVSISSATVHKHSAHSGAILEARCSAACRYSDTQQPFCGKVWLRVWVVCILHLNPLLSAAPPKFSLCPSFSPCGQLSLHFYSSFLKVIRGCSEHRGSRAVDILRAAGGNRRLTTKKSWDR